MESQKSTKEKHAVSSRLTFSRVHSFMLWLTLSVVFFLCTIRRYAISTWSDVLVKDFQADAALFGTLSGVYWYAYAILQVPSGIILDVFNR